MLPQCSHNTATIQSQYNHNTATMQPQCSHNAATMQPQCSQNTATTQSQYSHNTATIQPQCSPMQPNTTTVEPNAAQCSPMQPNAAPAQSQYICITPHNKLTIHMILYTHKTGRKQGEYSQNTATINTFHVNELSMF